MAEEPDRVAMLSDLTALRTELRSDITALETRLENRITAEHEETRRHFSIMVENVETAVKLCLEVNAHHGIILDDHENRPKKIERRR